MTLSWEKAREVWFADTKEGRYTVRKYSFGGWCARLSGEKFAEKPESYDSAAAAKIACSVEHDKRRLLGGSTSGGLLAEEDLNLALLGRDQPPRRVALLQMDCALLEAMVIVEWAYRQADAGHNLERTRAEARRLFGDSRASRYGGIAPDSESYPFLALSRRLGLDYGDVLVWSDRAERAHEKSFQISDMTLSPRERLAHERMLASQTAEEAVRINHLICEATDRERERRVRAREEDRR